MTKLLPLATLSEDQKAKLFVAFAGRYGPPAALAYLSHVPSAQAQAVCRKLLQMNLGVTTDIEAMDTAGASLAADVNVDGMTVGRTPLRVYLPPCAIALEVRSEGLLWKRGLALSPSSPDQKMVAVLPKGYRRDKGFVRDEIHRMEWTGRPSMRVNWLAADRLCLGGKNEDTFRLPTAEEALSLPVVVLEQLLEMDPAVPVWTSSSAGVGSGYYVVKEMTQERIEMSRSQPQGVLCVRNQVN